MQPYSVFLHAANDGVPCFQFVLCDDDESARVYALDELRYSPRYLEAEVVDMAGGSFRVCAREVAPA